LKRIWTLNLPEDEVLNVRFDTYETVCRILG